MGRLPKEGQLLFLEAVIAGFKFGTALIEGQSPEQKRIMWDRTIAAMEKGDDFWEKFWKVFQVPK